MWTAIVTCILAFPVFIFLIHLCNDTTFQELESLQVKLYDTETTYIDVRGSIAEVSVMEANLRADIASGKRSRLPGWKQVVKDRASLDVLVSGVEDILYDVRQAVTPPVPVKRAERIKLVRSVQAKLTALNASLARARINAKNITLSVSPAVFPALSAAATASPVLALTVPPSPTPAIVGVRHEPTIRLPGAFDGTSRAAWQTFRYALEAALTVDWKVYDSSAALRAVLCSVFSRQPLEYLVLLPIPSAAAYGSAHALDAAAKSILDQIEQLYGETPAARNREALENFFELKQNDRPFPEFFSDFMLYAAKAGYTDEELLARYLQSKISGELSTRISMRLGFLTGSFAEIRDACFHWDPFYRRVKEAEEEEEEEEEEQVREAPRLPARAAGVAPGICWDCGGRFKRGHMCEQKRLVQAAHRERT